VYACDWTLFFRCVADIRLPGLRVEWNSTAVLPTTWMCSHIRTCFQDMYAETLHAYTNGTRREMEREGNRNLGRVDDMLAFDLATNTSNQARNYLSAA